MKERKKERKKESSLPSVHNIGFILCIPIHVGHNWCTGVQTFQDKYNFSFSVFLTRITSVNTINLKIYIIDAKELSQVTH
jgi:hypothetical protein